MDTKNAVLELPDGTSIPVEDGRLDLLLTPNATVGDQWARFIIPAPVAGKYILHLHGRWAGDSNMDYAEVDYPFELASVPSFGEK
jgi:hypothetical protein